MSRLVETGLWLQSRCTKASSPGLQADHDAMGFRTPLSSYFASTSCQHNSAHCQERHHTEKSVRQSNRINPPHIRVRRKIWVDKEENWHIYRFAGIELLLLETETLDLAEIRRHLTRRDAVCCDSDNIRGAFVRGSVES